MEPSSCRASTIFIITSLQQKKSVEPIFMSSFSSSESDLLVHIWLSFMQLPLPSHHSFRIFHPISWILVVGDFYNLLSVALFRPNQTFSKIKMNIQSKLPFYDGLSSWYSLPTSTSFPILYESISKTYITKGSPFPTYQGLHIFLHGDVIANPSSYYMLITYL